MKRCLNLLFLLYISFSFAQKNDINWKTELDFGEGAVFTTFLNLKNKENQYLITSPKNADVRMLGAIKAKLGRITGKLPKKGAFLQINAIQKNDSLFGNTNLPIFGKLIFKGVLTQDILSGEFIKNDTLIIGTLYGLKSKEHSLDYTNLYSKILKTTKDNIYSKNVLVGKEWFKFQKKLKKLCNKSKDDIEFFIGFNMINTALPFSHYTIFIEEKKQENETSKVLTNKPTVVFEEKNLKTAYLKIKNFSTSQKELSEVLPNITKNKNYQNLIIDLRDNGGGGIDAAFELAKYIAKKDIEVGYFVTNKLKYSYFQPELFKSLPELQPKTAEEFGEDLKTGKGAKLIFRKSEYSTFSGNLYVLINKNTGSTCEPMVYALKNTLKATVIGEKTAGAMLAATWFDLDNKYVLMLPIADFYTYDGVRLEDVGVKPDIETTSDEALNKALDIIKYKSNK